MPITLSGEVMAEAVDGECGRMTRGVVMACARAAEDMAKVVDAGISDTIDT